MRIEELERFLDEVAKDVHPACLVAYDVARNSVTFKLRVKLSSGLWVWAEVDIDRVSTLTPYTSGRWVWAEVDIDRVSTLTPYTESESVWDARVRDLSDSVWAAMRDVISRYEQSLPQAALTPTAQDVSKRLLAFNEATRIAANSVSLLEVAIDWNGDEALDRERE